jgi:serine/threonine-protein kinase RsbT
VTSAAIVAKQETFQLHSTVDVAVARGVVRDWARDLGLTVLDLTKVVTAASELARNAVVHGGGGVMHVQVVRAGEREGLRVIFKDHGPGIQEIELAMRDGYTTAGGLGMGLPGAKRLVNEFDLLSTPSEGTCITIVRWKA